MITDWNAYWETAHTKYPNNGRVERARRLLERHFNDPRAGLITLRIVGEGKITLNIQSNTNPRPTARYTVDAAGCDCPDWPRASNGNCYHRIAALTLAYHAGLTLGMNR